MVHHAREALKHIKTVQQCFSHPTLKNQIN
jgi:hypothetical protein